MELITDYITYSHGYLLQPNEGKDCIRSSIEHQIYEKPSELIKYERALLQEQWTIPSGMHKCVVQYTD